MNNREIADHLEEAAELLESRGENFFRVRAYREGAKRVRSLPWPVSDIVAAQGEKGLRRLPGIGRSLAHTIGQLVRTGRWPLLDRLRRDNQPERLFTTVADIGPKLARRIRDHLGVETLAGLAGAASDGRLCRVPGMGEKRVRAVRESLAARLARSNSPGAPFTPRETATAPPVAELLDVDRQYRRLAREGRLPRTAPHRFNPMRQAWLPVLHTQRGDRRYTALFSNSARAHELGATRDWVVILLPDQGRRAQWTVITAGYGKLRGRRVVRGRESECVAHYEREGEEAVVKRGEQKALFDFEPPPIPMSPRLGESRRL